MAGQFGTQNRILGFKAESTAGTYNAPVGADFDVEFFEVTSPEFDYGMGRQSNPANGNLTQAQSKSGIISTSFTAKSRLKYTGDQTTAPNQGKIWEAAGLVQSGGGASPVVYTYSGQMPCNTLSAICSDLNCGASPVSIDKKVRGIQANLVFSAGGIGQEITCDYTFNGAYETEVDNASPVKVLTGIDTGASEKLLGTTFDFGGVNYIIHSFSLDLGNTVSMVGDPSKTGGIYQYKITGTDCKLTCQVQKIDITTSTMPTDITGDTQFTAMSIGGTHWNFEITDANLVSRKDADAEGIVAEDLEFEVRGFTLTQAD